MGRLAEKASGVVEMSPDTEAGSVVAFVQEHYGQEGVIRFFNALGKSTSLEDALEAGFQVKFGEFNRQWSRWIAGK
jgi:hypothetical protein